MPQRCSWFTLKFNHIQCFYLSQREIINANDSCAENQPIINVNSQLDRLDFL